MWQSGNKLFLEGLLGSIKILRILQITRLFVTRQNLGVQIRSYLLFGITTDKPRCVEET